MMTDNIHKPIYCRNCRSQDSFELYPEKDITTESGRVFMLGYRCKECGKIVIMTNPTYKSPSVLHLQRERAL